MYDRFDVYGAVVVERDRADMDIAAIAEIEAWLSSQEDESASASE